MSIPQKILVCQPSQVVDNSGICPQGQAITIIEGYILSQEEHNFLTELNSDLDYSQLSTAFSFGFVTIMTFYCLGKGIGLIWRSVR